MVCEDSSSSSETASSSKLFKISSSSSSAESSFRELDDAFLQSQTRIWLGEVLQIRLDEKLVISQLLADGELLFQVSKVVWKLLLAKHMELRHIKAYKYQPFASKKNSGRYRPYSNVDSFLKICKILGLTGVDLFSPSDVVERRNTRKVPDFDIVTCMVAMPKDVVGCIRRNIELSHSILSDSSSSYHLQKHARGLKSRQGYSVTGSIGDYKIYSDESEDTENKQQFDDLHTDDLYDYTMEINYDVESPIESVYLHEDLDELDIQYQERNEVLSDDFDLLCSMESLQYHCSKNIDHGCETSSSISLPGGDLHADLIGLASHLDNRVEQVQENEIMDLDCFEIEHVLLSTNASVIGTPPNDRTRGTRDASWHGKDRKDDLDLFHKENSIPNVHQSASSYGSNPTPQTAENCKCFETGDNMEFAGMNHLSRDALNLQDQFDIAKNIESFELHNDKIKEEYESRGMMKCFVKKFEETKHSLYSPDCYFCNSSCSDRAVSYSNDINSTSLKKLLAYEEKGSQVDLKRLDNASYNQSEEFLSNQPYYLPESCKWDQKGKCAIKLGTDDKEKNNKCEALASNAQDVDDCGKGSAPGDDANDFCKGVTTQVIGDKVMRPPHVIANDVVVPSNCNEDVSSCTESYITNQSPKLELNHGHQACQYGKDPNNYHSEHTHVVHIKEGIKPEDESVKSLENLLGTEEGGMEIPKARPQKKLLLKSFLGGAAAVGLLFMFLHLRRNGGEKVVQPSMPSNHEGKKKIQKNSPGKVKSISTTKGVYPAEKIKLK
ncbi:hypothetical protein RJT34_03084 [Clitoria ternatea]|uniref:Calponin-homology (CH) domain-containing protein n=1 Tax=Clitoria ternatea TaxID=43366 RepID=A0AAN9KI96_CLITE